MQSALARVADPNGSPWDPGGAKTFFAHVGAIMNTLASNDRRSFRARRLVLDGDLGVSDTVAGGGPPADDALAAREALARKARLGTALLAELDANDPRAAAIYRAVVDGVEGHAALAERAGCKIEEVRYAYDRIKYHGRRLLERERQAEEDRMRETQRTKTTASASSRRRVTS